MPNKPVQIAAERMPENANSLLMNAQDKISEGIDFSRLIFNAVQGIGLDDDLRSLSAAAYAVEKKLKEVQILIDQARGWPIGH